MLIVAELLQVGVFFLTDADGVRLVSVVVPNVLAAALLLAGRGHRNVVQMVLGLSAMAAPWLFRLLAEPIPAVVSAAALVCALAALFLTTESRRRRVV